MSSELESDRAMVVNLGSLGTNLGPMVFAGKWQQWFKFVLLVVPRG